ncbi:MAG: serine hydrolase domain-containing protein, partial [Planctomycetaceae bacterium]
MPLSRRSFLGSVTGTPLLLGLGPWGDAPVWAQHRESRLPRGLPEEQGVDSRGVLALLDGIAAAKLNLHSLMVVRHGKVIAQGWWAPYAPHLRHTMYSLSKSFCSTAVGLAAAEKRLSLDDTVVSFFPNDLPEMVGDRLADLRVRHLLMMGTGHPGDSLFGPGFTVAEKNWVRSVLARPLAHEPGTHFAYNNGATFLCSAIVQQTTGQTLLDFLNPRLFAPLGIADADWEQNPAGMNHGAFGLRVRTEDIAKLGQLYLSQGVWDQQPVLTPDWVRDATGKQIENAPPNDPARRATSDWAQGYG